MILFIFYLQISVLCPTTSPGFMGLTHNRNYPYTAFNLFLLVHSFYLQFTTAFDTITVNGPLRDPDTLVSNGKRFKLGFFTPPGSSYRYVGVMYNFPVLSVVWVANRNSPLKDSMGSLEVSSDGNLVILDGRNNVIWSTYLRTPIANSSAVLLDSGNLVLQDHLNTTYVWESFQHPSDSLVEKMKMFTDLTTKEKIILSSWKSASDPSPGSFNLTIELTEVPQVFVWKQGYPYWRSGPWNGQIFTGITTAHSLYKRGVYVDSNSSSAYVTLLNLPVLLYYVLNASGALQDKVWSYEKGEWEVVWSSIGTECDIYGRCGLFGICNAMDKPVCSCLQGFVPKSNEEWKVGNWSSGCIRKTRLQCERNSSSVGKQDGFVKVNGVKLPDHFKLIPLYVDDCRMQCLRNCSCGAYAYSQGIGCMQWSENLIDVKKFSSGGDDLYIRLADSELGDKKYKKSIIATTVALGFSVLIVCTYFLLKFVIKNRAERKQKNKQMHGVKLEDLPMFTFQMLSNATRKFELPNKLVQGGFGPVFKGILPNGQEIAVKRLARSSKQGLEEFVNEVEVISKLQHRNLVRLLGCCVESEEKLLVYEYMPNKSLDAYLFDPHKQKFLDWKTRVDITEGICRGLLYLHRDSRLRIIHRDLKASNILLDGELNPKISDFGMTRIFGGKDDQANTTRVVGTYGYIAPEYALHGIFSEKSDVYSFGVLLLEIVSGKRNAQFCDNNQLLLIAYAWKLWNEENVVDLIDAAVYDPEIEDDIVRYAHVGLLCVQEIASDRPNISTVLSMLNRDIVELPCPKQPAFLAIRRSTETTPSQKNSSKCSLNDVTMTNIGGR